MKIILDGMGGDNAPRAVVEGAAQALREFPDIEIVLTGDPAILNPALQEAQADMARVRLVGTTQTILMSDSPVRAMREKPDSSMARALRLLAEEQEDALMISAGNTGALVAGATLIVRRIKGVKRPALAPVLPTRLGAVLLIDGGANAECKPAYLAQFGIMGSIYMEKVFGIKEPRVALINNGGEAGKGSPLTKEAYKLLKKSPVRFLGNVEGRDLLSGQYDVLVTDGFTGNIVLKFVEGCSRTILGMLKEYIRESVGAKIGAAFMRGAFDKLKQKMDYKEYGGALLLGLNQGVMKAHGSSDGRAMFAAIRAARSFLENGVVPSIRTEVTRIEAAAEREKAARAAAEKEKAEKAARAAEAPPAKAQPPAKKEAAEKKEAAKKRAGGARKQSEQEKKPAARKADGGQQAKKSKAGAGDAR